MVEFAGEPVRLGEYTLLGVLGQGGQGVVHLAEDASGRRVAVKILHAHLAGDERAQRAFVNEVRAIGRIAEFCTTRVLDVGVAHGRPYIVSEYVDAESLQDAVQRDGPRGEAALHRLAVGTAAALAVVHRARVVHRDFKPHNVLLAADGPRVIDFGVARALESASTTTTNRIGTLAYMAPEQISGAASGRACDVFSWAGTMVFAATGRPPFGHEHPGAVMHAILTRAPDLDGVPVPFRDLLGRCLDKDPAERPTAKELFDRLLDEELSRTGENVDLGRALHDEMERVRSMPPPTRPDPAEADAPALPESLSGGGSGGGRRGPSRRAVLAGLAGTSGVAALAAISWYQERRTNSPDGRFGTQLGGTVLVLDGGEVQDVELVPVPGAMVLYTFHSVGVARLWEPVTGIRIRSLGEKGDWGESLFVGSAGGTAMAVSRQGWPAPELWDLASGRRLESPLVAKENWDTDGWKDGGRLIGLAPFDGHLAAYFTMPAERDGAVMALARDVMSGKTLQEPWTVVRRGPVTVKPVDLAGRGVLLVRSSSGGEPVQVWDASSRSPMGPPMRTAFGGDGALEHVLAPVPGSPILLAGYRDGTIRRWDVTSGKQMQPPLTGHRKAVFALWAGSLARRPAVVSGGGDDGVRVWDPRTGRAWGGPLTGHVGQVNAVAGGTVAGRPIVVSGSADGAIRQWVVEPHAS